MLDPIPARSTASTWKWEYLEVRDVYINKAINNLPSLVLFGNPVPAPSVLSIFNSIFNLDSPKPQPK
jgi:hypothetical protein